MVEAVTRDAIMGLDERSWHAGVHLKTRRKEEHCLATDVVGEFSLEGPELWKVAADQPGSAAAWRSREGAWFAEIFVCKAEVVIAAKTYYAAVIEEIAGSASFLDRRHSAP